MTLVILTDLTGILRFPILKTAILKFLFPMWNTTKKFTVHAKYKILLLNSKCQPESTLITEVKITKLNPFLQSKWTLKS